MDANRGGQVTAPVSALEGRRRHLLTLLDDPESRAKSSNELALATGLAPKTVTKLRTERGVTRVRHGSTPPPPPPAVLRGLSARQVQLLREVFDGVLRGADMRNIVRGDTGREVYRAILAAGVADAATHGRTRWDEPAGVA